MNYLVFDTETANTPKIDGQLDTTSGQVYDLGGLVIDEAGNVLDRFSLVNRDVFCDMPQAMKEAYYADKIPAYWREIWAGERKVVNTYEMWKIFREKCKQWQVVAVVAHNASFDVRVLNSTMRYQSKSKRRYFLPYGVPVIDSMKLALATIAQTAEYKAFCESNGYMTKHAVPRPRVTAEVLWRYLNKTPDFIESHTGLEDATIEAAIFLACKA